MGQTILPSPLPFSGSRSRAIEHHTFIDYFLRRGVNFINILPAAFMHADPKSAKNTVKLSIFFALLGSAGAKAACRMLMKLTRGAVTVV